jgi:hypothetical protein
VASGKLDFYQGNRRDSDPSPEMPKRATKNSFYFRSIQ